MARGEALLLAAFWLALMCAYWLTMPPDITFEDTPLFAATCATLGLPHPPGYPAHTLYCAPFAQAMHFFGFPYARGAALGSAFGAATACTLLAWLMNRMFRSRPASLLAAGLLALSPQVWAQAVIPEVYALNMLMVVSTMVCVHFYVSGGTARWLVALAFVTGQGLAAHWPLYVLVYPAFLIWLAPHWRRVARDLFSHRSMTWCLLAFAAGLSPYIHLLTVSEDSFRFDEEYSIEDLIPYIRRDLYGIGDSTLGFSPRIGAISSLSLSFIPAFQYVYALLAVVGLALYVSCRKWNMLLVILYGYLSCTFFLSLFRSYESTSEISVWIYSVYPLASFAFISLAVAHATAFLFRKTKWNEATLNTFVAANLVVIAAIWWEDQDRSNENIALPYARLVLDSVPSEKGLVVVFGSDFNFAIRYAEHFNEGKDLPETIKETEFFTEARDDGTMLPEDERMIVEDSREIAYVMRLEPETFGSRFHGIYSAVARDLPPGKVEVEIPDDVRELIDHVIDVFATRPRNPFTHEFLEQLLIGYVVGMLKAQNSGFEISHEDELQFTRALLAPVGQYAQFMSRALDPNNAITLGELERMMESIRPHFPHLRGKRRQEILHIYSVALIQKGQIDRGKQVLQEALRIFPSAGSSKVIIDLLQVHDANEDYDSYRKLRRRFPDADVGTSVIEQDKRCNEHFGSACAIEID